MFESENIKNLEGKFFGLYRGIISNVNDPEHLGRIKVYCPAVYGKDDNGTLIESGWVLPCMSFIGNGFGAYFIPPASVQKKRIYVWIEFEMGDPNFPVWVGMPIGEYNKMSELHNSFKKKPNGSDRVVPNNYGIITPGGHKIEMDDDSGSKAIRITHSSGYQVVLDGSSAVFSGNVVVKGGITSNGNVNAPNIE